MVWHIPISTASNQEVISLAEDDNLYVAKNVTLTTTGADPVIGILGGHGGTHDIRVYGTIVGEYYAVLLNLGTSASNIRVLVGEEGHLETLTANYAIQIGGINQQLDNRGMITGPFGGAVFSEGVAGATKALDNSGTISGGSLGVVGSTVAGETFNINNRGLIEGDRSFLFFGSGANVITNSGHVVGDIEFADGADTYNGTSGRLSGFVYGGAGNDTMRGGIDNDTFNGDDGADRLYGGSGNDRLSGGAGNDLLYGETGADILSGGTGLDRALYTNAKSGIIVSLTNSAMNSGDAKGDTYSSIENVSGSAFNDYIYGDGAANALDAGNGNDAIRGYAGNDTLTGGAGKDTFIFNTALNSATNVDRITDFSAVDDVMWIDNAIFVGLAAGQLASSMFKDVALGTKDSNDHILYDSNTGNLFFDRDGTGATYGAVRFASLTGSPTLTAADFFVI